MASLGRAVEQADRAATPEEKLAAAEALFGAAVARFGPDLWLAWTGGKDSTLLVWLARRVCAREGWPLPRIVTIDEGDAFPEIVAFQDRLVRQWGLDCRVAANAELLASRPAVGDYIPVTALGPANRAALSRLGFTGPGFPFDPDSPLGSHLGKTVPLAGFVTANRVAALAVAIRRDEHPARIAETYQSPRPDPPHVRVHPLLHLAERDVWDLTLAHAIPSCPLYATGYRSLGTRSGSRPAADVPAWEQDLEHTPERAGRALDKERAMGLLRSLGYL